MHSLHKFLFIIASFLPSLLFGEDSKASFYLKENPQTPKGSLFKHHAKSRFLKNRREVWVYTPYGYHSKADPYPLLIVFDGQAYAGDLIDAPTILDNMICQGAIPPLVAFFVSSIDQKTRDIELPCHHPFAEYVAHELLPWAHAHYNVTKNPKETGLAGSSYGGLAAFYTALLHPHLFGNVLSQSGAFWWSPKKESEPEWITGAYKLKKTLPIKFYLDVGLDESAPYGKYPSTLSVNRRMRDLLLQKGYSVVYQEFKGGHDYEYWKREFPKGLLALFGALKTN